MPGEIEEPVLISTWYVYGEALVGFLPDGDRGNALVPISCFGDSAVGSITDGTILHAMRVGIDGDSVAGELSDGDSVSGAYFTRFVHGESPCGVLSEGICVIYPDAYTLQTYFAESDYSPSRSVSNASQASGSVESDYQLT